jgi:KDO2-lipid IV(A) lauroyltransferase
MKNNMAKKITKLKMFQYRIEYIGVLLALFMLDKFSLARLTSMTRGCSNVFFALNKGRRDVAIDNILKAGITDDYGEARRIARDSFAHFAVLILESLKTANEFTEDNWLDKVEHDIPDETFELLKKEGQGLILVSGHFGNWEVAGQLISFMKPVLGITKDIKNPYVNRLMKERKPRNNFRITPKQDKDSGRFLRAIKDGEVLALLADQYASSRGIKLEFFGREASTFTSPALFHLISKAPIVFGYCLRKGPMQYKFVTTKPMNFKPSGNRIEDQKLIMSTLNGLLEDAIRLAPEQYLWGHRRWK